MMSPLIGVATINACLFGVYGHLMDWQRELYGEDRHYLWNVFIAGCGSGLVNSIISCPSELAKIQLQNQVKERRFRGPWQCFQEIYRTHGLLGCYRGMGATILRETPSYGVYFWCFEGLRGWYGNGDDRNGWRLMAAGGISGVLGWLSTYPFDVVKTRIQAMLISSNAPYSSFGMLHQIATKEGPRALFKGINATIIRAFPTNAVIFYTYAWSMNYLNGGLCKLNKEEG